MRQVQFDAKIRLILSALLKGTITARKLAKIAGISKRQVYRYVNYLREIGYDIPGAAGVGFAMHLSGSQPPPPPVFLKNTDHMRVVMMLAAGWRWRGHLPSEFFAEVFQIRKQRITRTFCFLRQFGYKIAYHRSSGYEFISAPRLRSNAGTTEKETCNV
jgi:predicted DNA-binding transcriptional regulator YafY